MNKIRNLCVYFGIVMALKIVFLCRFIEFPGVSTRIQNHLKRALCSYGFKTLKIFAKFMKNVATRSLNLT